MLSIIIVHYRDPEALGRCLESVSGASLPVPVEILVVDNDSGCEGTVRRICRDSRQPLHLIWNRRNEGLARAANQAFQTSRGEYILHLNPDVQVLCNAVKELYCFLESHPKVGVVFPKLLDRDGAVQLSCRKFYDWPTVVLRRTPWLRSLPWSRVDRHLMKDADRTKSMEVDWALGAAFLVRRDALQADRLFDDRYFLYLEDVDLCMDLWKRGWKVVYHPAAVMLHDHRRRSARHPFSRANWEHLRSYMKFVLKHSRFGTSRGAKWNGEKAC